MKVEAAVPYEDWIQRPSEVPRFLADPGTGQQSLAEALNQAQAAKAVSLSIGPEGGFTVREIEDALRAGWSTLQLGTTTLRIETAAMAAAALFNITGN